MKLYLRGHDYKYAAEQMLLTLFPAQRPEYPAGPPRRGGRAGALPCTGGGLGHRHGGAELWGTGIPGRPPVPDGGADRPAVHRPGAPADFEAGLLRRGHRRPGQRAPWGR